MKIKLPNSQKGLTPIVIILIVVGVIVVGGGLFISNIRQQAKEAQDRVTSARESKDSSGAASNVQDLLDKIEKKNYIFYYPKKFVELKPLNQLTALYYGSKNNPYTDQGYGIYLQVEQPKSRIPVASYDLCNKVMGSFTKNATDTKIQKVDSFELPNSYGCNAILSTSIEGQDKNIKVRDELIDKIRILWYKQGDDLGLYTVRATYYASEPKETSDALDLAVSQFTLK